MRAERGTFGARNRLLGQDERDRRTVAELEHLPGQPPRRRVGPLRVLDREDDRLRRCESLDQANKGAVCLLLRRGCPIETQPEQSGERAENGLGLVAEQRTQPGTRLRTDCDLRLADLRAEPAEEDLDERPTG